MTDPRPTLSVVIRSYERGAAVIELIEAVLRQQNAPTFEIVVVEQSQAMASAHVARLRELEADPRIRLLSCPPLGGPRARNVGARASRGDILLFMDDDDLPEGDDWLAKHVANFADPACLAVTGGQRDLGKPDPPYPNMDRARHVETVHGGNTAIRRSVLERVGLWDECTPVEDETRRAGAACAAEVIFASLR